MIPEVLWAFVLTAGTVALHAIGTVKVLVPVSGCWSPLEPDAPPRRPIVLLVRLVSGMLILHLISMALWATAFVGLGVFENFEKSCYYSAMSYTTVGYGDLSPPIQWRLLGPIEAAVGVLMLGLSTGLIVSAVQRIYRATE